MGYQEFPPPVALQDWVKCLWTIEEQPTGVIQEIWPDGCIEVFFSSGSIVLVNNDGATSPFPKFCAVGLQTGIMRVRCESAIRILSARLYPYLNRCWTHEHLETFYLSIQPLLDGGDLERARKELEGWLVQQPRVEDELTASFRSLYENGGALSIDQLASEGHRSSRQLQRLFGQRLGIAPKRVAQLIRFARAWSTMLAKPNMTLAELALELGYSDQAHFTHEFRRFATRPPGEFRKSV